MRDKKGISINGKEGGKELGEEGWEPVISIYCVGKSLVSTIGGKAP